VVVVVIVSPRASRCDGCGARRPIAPLRSSPISVGEAIRSFAERDIRVMHQLQSRRGGPETWCDPRSASRPSTPRDCSPRLYRLESGARSGRGPRQATAGPRGAGGARRRVVDRHLVPLGRRRVGTRSSRAPRSKWSITACRLPRDRCALNRCSHRSSSAWQASADGGAGWRPLGVIGRGAWRGTDSTATGPGTGSRSATGAGFGGLDLTGTPFR
jgi:hypothetical protein